MSGALKPVRFLKVTSPKARRAARTQARAARQAALRPPADPGLLYSPPVDQSGGYRVTD